jgi:hypothetical protein
VVAAHYKKDDLLNCWNSSSDISGYDADFHEGHGTFGAWQVCGIALCELANGIAGERHGRGMGAAWARHAVCESIFNISHESRHVLSAVGLSPCDPDMSMGLLERMLCGVLCGG